jgi:creatinine amidohydrolase
MQSNKVKYAELNPAEFKERMKERPIAYLPLGTLEWHGDHLPLGTDSILSEGLMVECAKKFGGIVLPPIFLGPDRLKLNPQGKELIGMDYALSNPDEKQLPGSSYWVSNGFFMCIIDSILEQLKRAGFKEVFADGHGPSRRSWINNLEERENRFGMKLFGVNKELADGWVYQIGHAAKNESSLMQHFRPDLVNLSNLGEDRNIKPLAVNGEDPRDATAALGEMYVKQTLKLLEKVL